MSVRGRPSDIYRYAMQAGIKPAGPAIADAAGVSRTTMWRCLNGLPVSADTALAIMAVLHLGPGEGPKIFDIDSPADLADAS